jgi:hypothetical protein
MAYARLTGLRAGQQRKQGTGDAGVLSQRFTAGEDPHLTAENNA